VNTTPDFVERIVEPLRNESRVGLVASVLVRPDADLIDSVGITVDPTLAGFPRLRGQPSRRAESVAPVLTGPVGAAGAYRRAAWEAVGGLDEGVLGYGEDVDLALRMRTAGWEATVAPGAVAVHVGSASFGRRSAWQRYHGGFARGYFLRRYGILRTRLGLRALTTETIVVAGDAVISRDLSALRGRIAGWRSAGGLPRRPIPPSEAVDQAISFAESLHLRRVVYAT
jgi:GT2 family glycosyltransferase